MSIITVEHLSKRYGEVLAVDDVSLGVEEGEIFGILGRNGAGKTTTVECIEGLRRGDTGRVVVAGLDPHDDSKRLRHVLGAQLQQAKLPDKLRVGEALELYRSFYTDGTEPVALAEELGLGHALRTPFDALSGGQQQRLSVALALIGKPRIAILDEVTTGLDPHARQQAWQLIERIRESGVTVVLVTHLMEEAERLCDRLAIIDRGRIIATGTPSELIGRIADGVTARLICDRPIDAGSLPAFGDGASVRTSDHALYVTGSPADLQAAFIALGKLEITVADLTIQQPNLADAFLQLTSAEETIEEFAA